MKLRDLKDLMYIIIIIAQAYKTNERDEKVLSMINKLDERHLKSYTKLYEKIDGLTIAHENIKLNTPDSNLDTNHLLYIIGGICLIGVIAYVSFITYNATCSISSELKNSETVGLIKDIDQGLGVGRKFVKGLFIEDKSNIIVRPKDNLDINPINKVESKNFDIRSVNEHSRSDVNNIELSRENVISVTDISNTKTSIMSVTDISDTKTSIMSATDISDTKPSIIDCDFDVSGISTNIPKNEINISVIVPTKAMGISTKRIIPLTQEQIDELGFDF
jgi:hypothetical protein